MPQPLTVVLRYPPNQSNSTSFSLVTDPLKKKKMDLATNPVFKAFLAGTFSGTCSTVLFQPLDLVKTRLQQTGSAKSNSMITVVRNVLQTDRVIGLWRGIAPSIAKTVPGVGLYFSSLHWLQVRVGEKPSPILAICMGMTARSFAATVMIPVTVLKTRFESAVYNYPRMSTALVQIYSREGFRGLTCGLLPTLVRDAPFSGLYLMFYTQLKQRIIFAEEFKPAANFGCGLCAGFLASLVTHPADVIKTKMQLRPDIYCDVRQTALVVLRQTGPRGFLVGLTPRMMRRTLMSAFAWTVYERIMQKIGLK